MAAQASGVLATLLANTPTLEAVRRSGATAIVGAGKAMLLREFVHAEAPFRHTWTVGSGDLERLGIPSDAGLGPHGVNDQMLMAFANLLNEAASQYQPDPVLDLSLERAHTIETSVEREVASRLPDLHEVVVEAAVEAPRQA